MIKSKITIGINDSKVEIPLSKGAQTLAKYLREHRHLSGLKIVCAEGDCGACAVLIDRHDSGRYQVFNSCIMPLMIVQGAHIITVEGLAEKYPQHPIKTALVDNLGSQCGFCTPGFMMTLANVYDSSLQRQSKPAESDIKLACSGHLCRCTGYQDILNGAMTAIQQMTPQQRLADAFAEIRQQLQSEEPANYFYKLGDECFAVPKSLKQACFWKAKYPHLQIVAGATDLGVEMNKKEEYLRSWMSLKNIEVLNRVIKRKDGTISFGANVSLSQVQRSLKTAHPEFSEFLKIFASPNIRHCGTLIGNIVNASPIGDTLPYLVAIGATVKVASLRGFRNISLEEFIVGYRRTDLKDDEIVVSLTLNPRPLGSLVKIHKVSKREHMDISTLSMAAMARVENGVLVDFSCVFGGLSERVRKDPQLEAHWRGRNIEDIQHETVDLAAYFKPMSDHRGSQRYRKIVAERLLGDFFNQFEAAP